MDFMSPEFLTLAMFLTLVAAIVMGHPLAFTLAAVSTIFGLIDLHGNVSALFDIYANNIWGLMDNYTLVAIPLFILMAQLLDKSKVSDKLFEALYVVLGSLRGGLGLAVIVVCTVFAATTGIIGASVVLWVGHFLILRGVKSASFMNGLVTLAKLAPIAIFILAVFFAFKLNIFTKDIWGSSDLGSLFNQVKGTMLVTVWSFIGIEGAVIFSGRAKRRSDVAKASFFGLYTVIAIYVLVTVLSLGVMTRPELAGLSAPGMAGVLEAVVGKWGAVLVNIGVIVSVLGAWLAWTMFSFELPFRAAEKGTFPAVFTKTNKNGTPVVALTITNGLVQLFLFTFLLSASAYNLGYSLATSTILVPYLLTALYQLKLSLQEKAGTPGRTFNVVVGAVATIYGAWLIYAAGLKYLLLTAIIYGAGVVVYVLMRTFSGKKPLTIAELAVAAVFVVGGVYAIQQLISGGITL